MEKALRGHVSFLFDPLQLRPKVDEVWLCILFFLKNLPHHSRSPLKGTETPWIGLEPRVHYRREGPPYQWLWIPTSLFSGRFGERGRHL